LWIQIYFCWKGTNECFWSRNTDWGGRLSTVDVLVLASPDQLLLILNFVFTFQRTDPSSSVSVHCLTIWAACQPNSQIFDMSKSEKVKNALAYFSWASALKKKVFNVDAAGQWYKSFYHGNLMPLRGYAVILWNKPILPW